MRLDRFQLDMFEVFEKARELSRSDSQVSFETIQWLILMCFDYWVC